jgi:trigger factor
VKIEVKEGSGLKREISVEIPADTVQSEMDTKLGEIRTKVELKGFRKGKAPMNIIRSQYGDQVKAEVVDELFRQSMGKAVDSNNLKIASRPTVTALDFSDDGAMVYKAEIEVFPEVENVVFEGLELKQAEMTVQDKEVDGIVEQYRKQFSDLRVLERPAETTDLVIVDLKKVADPNKVLAAEDFDDSQIDLSNPVTVKEFREQIPGMKAGDEKDIEVVYDDDYPDATFAGAHVTYKCIVKTVNERLLPEVDDPFAKRTGLAETALELKLKIRERLQQEKETQQKRLQRREIVNLLCDKNDVTIPDGPVNEYLDNLVKDFKEKGEEFEEKDLRDKYRPIGIRSMQWDLLWRTLVDQESIEVLPEDTENWIKGFAAYNGVTVEQAKASLQQAGKTRELRESILEEKVISFLMDKATIVPV